MRRMLLRGIAAALSACAPAGLACADVRLAVGAPITGASAAFGRQIERGAMQAVEDINASGGILGERIVLSAGDDASDPRRGAATANKFAADGVNFVIGHFNSAVAVPASRIYAEHAMLMISPAAINAQLTEKGRWNVFRICGREDQQGRIAGAYLIENFKDKKIAFLHDRSNYGKTLVDQVRTFVTARGPAEVLYEPIDPGRKDYSAVVSKIESSGADIVYWGGLQTEAGLLIRQMHDRGLRTVLMGGDGIVTDDLATIAGPAVVGTLMTFPPDARKRPEAAAVVKAFLDKKYDPEAYTLYSYAAVQIIRQATEKAGALDARKVAEALHSGAIFKTVIGDIAFDKKGDVTRPDYMVYVWRRLPDGRIEYGPQ